MELISDFNEKLGTYTGDLLLNMEVLVKLGRTELGAVALIWTVGPGVSTLPGLVWWN